ncbi:hypothetical protein EV421DRAFT_1915322 [Armillaria borealis]|uniref:Uncharacterized protein n=1 Tax=Armillaria borealis TaxID=47425 RepID=A0AA39ICA3_9AGAR|nr:hypothetical protein EV421DRAFT_1915322 [Armillaria borealis]
MAKLRKRCKIAEGKKKVGSAEAQKHKFQSASVVESGGEDGNVSAGPLVPKHLKTEPEPMAQDKVYTGSEHCGKCQTDKATCFICSRVRTCQYCCVKKARCTFNKGGDDGGSTESTSVLEILQDISAVEDLVDDYDVNNEVKYPEDFVPKSIKTEFKAEVVKHQLDRDMALIKAEGLMSLSSELPLSVDDPYEILNKLFWIGTVEWQLWKRLLKDQEGYQVEDLDEPLDLEEEIRMDMIPGAESIGIPDLDALIKMPMPMEDPEEEAEKECRRQATVKMRARKCEKGEEVESEVEMYEDLEQVLVQEEVEKDVEMVGLSSADAA